MAFSNGNSNGPMADINVTPLVDVMLVLLIIFIITAPLMSHKVKVELPQANLVNKNNEEKRSNPITLAVKEDGSLYWNDIQISESELEQRFSLAAQQTPLNLRGDRTTKMSKISKIIKVAQGQGIMDIGFIATKEKE
ncbi:biopolymer transporter ExbD [Xylella fastidiosa subsp. fastidiosa]|uniref:Biopolymer transport protein ExbD/TolR n=1 Tax=Xylella fastidiosa (strain M23) TaxID=405441 RepID=B2I642_XYLF2|nr:biopolymer transporter ExbD [Xylella fastidiosa]ACB91469.1 Biopolymer transport protein ExbD/TolR [Xylella fastidiosa M23]MBE0262897.1 biopolymer transporter ExbD [Xylella fastidiosa subsp. fastidiosa]MBE0265073.1 biopolymer transporter ExbD [Xylella fastidiosa subsp. fastidiosa]MBE0267330.1 biopolymer transporter ExbD [Xylella fastidiosa subsp. fastidiosa]MBE0271733.1 biopolymer transporter ExbD [Xylella fastidiosa subsp. fastidiosa]